MSVFPLLARMPPADDELFVRHVARVGRRLPPRTALTYWRSRRTFVRNLMANAGFEEDEITTQLARFEAAVRAEAARLRARQTELEDAGDG